MPELPLEMDLGPMMVDVSGVVLDENEKKFLGSSAIGSVILFARNYQSRGQITKLISKIKSIRSPALLVCVDQEGGRVQRFKDGFFPMPPAYRFGQAYDYDPKLGVSMAHSAGTLMATELIEVGVDFSFAPVLDCADLNSKVIGDRGFHQSPEVICKLAGAFIDGMNQAGMVATGKHFPGHGGVVDDSHQITPIDNRNLEQLQDCDLLPYKNLYSKLGGVMTAHVQYPKIDESLPTFSNYWLQHILRKEIGFDGVVFSDDLSMKGAHVAGDPVQRTNRALDAGCDVALICNDPENARSVVDELGDSIIVDQSKLSLLYANTHISSDCDFTALKNQLSQLV